MQVKDLRALLKNFPDESEVVVPCPERGNSTDTDFVQLDSLEMSVKVELMPESRGGLKMYRATKERGPLSVLVLRTTY